MIVICIPSLTRWILRRESFFFPFLFCFPHFSHTFFFFFRWYESKHLLHINKYLINAHIITRLWLIYRAYTFIVLCVHCVSSVCSAGSLKTFCVGILAMTCSKIVYFADTHTRSIEMSQMKKEKEEEKKKAKKKK